MTAYIKLSTQDYPRHAGDIEIDPAGMADYAHVEWVDPPQIDRNRQRMAEGKPKQVNGVWQMQWVVTPIPDSEQAVKVRADRNTKLAECDWTQGKDIPDAVSQPWAVYRQALRDVPEQAGFPWDVKWPEQPK